MSRKYCSYYKESLPVKINYCPYGHEISNKTGTNANGATNKPTEATRTRICPAGFKRLTRGGGICPYGFKNGVASLDMASARFHGEGVRKYCPFYGANLPSKFGYCPMGHESKEVGPSRVSMNGVCPIGFRSEKQPKITECPFGFTNTTGLDKTKKN